MTQEEIVQAFQANTITGDDLLNLPITNKYDAGRVLVEMYYYLLDVNEARILYETNTTVYDDNYMDMCEKARRITNQSIATALKEIWCEE